jgi:hypothetical protein
MLRPGLAALVVVALSAPRAVAADPKTVEVKSREELRAAVAAAGPGTRIEIAAGDYGGGWLFREVHGAEGRPVVLAAKDPLHPPEFRGGGVGIQLTGAVHVELAGLSFSGQTGNGINVDDGGVPATPTHHVVLRALTVRDVGPDGNCDGIKLSGLTDFRVENCTLERWGRGGSAVDMVGCSAGVIERCVLRHSADATGASGVQMKGGTRDVAVRRCRFENAGSRAVNAGGSTGLVYFRPPLAEWKGPKYEAKDLVVEGCTFVGSDAPVAFVGVDGAKFRFNTVARAHPAGDSRRRVRAVAARRDRRQPDRLPLRPLERGRRQSRRRDGARDVHVRAQLLALRRRARPHARTPAPAERGEGRRPREGPGVRRRGEARLAAAAGQSG